LLFVSFVPAAGMNFDENILEMRRLRWLIVMASEAVE
jgi:hypothetical protein